jgi:hypothetical protein
MTTIIAGETVDLNTPQQKVRRGKLIQKWK